MHAPSAVAPTAPGPVVRTRRRRQSGAAAACRLEHARNVRTHRKVRHRPGPAAAPLGRTYANGTELMFFARLNPGLG